MKRSKTLLIVGAAVALALLFLVVFMPSSQSFADPNQPGTKHDNSFNWSGYVVEPSFSSPQSGVVQDVKATWTVPEVSGTGNAYSSTWIGIDGWSSRTVEQIGTEQEVIGGQPVYFAWWETYPKPNHQLGSSYPVSAGDVMNAEVQYIGNSNFTLSIKDLGTTNSLKWKFSTTEKVAQAQRQSAEWVVEGALRGPFAFPLADFGHTYFTNAQATISSHPGSIADLAWEYKPITLVSSNGATVRAEPENLSPPDSLSSFDVLWLNP